MDPRRVRQRRACWGAGLGEGTWLGEVIRAIMCDDSPYLLRGWALFGPVWYPIFESVMSGTR